MTTPILDAADLRVIRAERAILDGISLTVPPQASVLVQGRSGAGKTTLFEILGLLDAPTSGTLHVNGTNTTAMSERDRVRLRRDELGFVFQDFRLIEDLTAWENARLPQEHTGAVNESWLESLFDQLGLTGLREQYPRTLSGGERQRIAIARALANQPSLVLADEPTGQLDPETTQQVLDLLFSMHVETETALVTISHDPQLADPFDRTVTLADGTLHEVDSP